MQISLKMSIMLVWELFSSIATIPAISASAAPENENRENLQYGFRFSSRICITEIGIRSRLRMGVPQVMQWELFRQRDSSLGRR